MRRHRPMSRMWCKERHTINLRNRLILKGGSLNMSLTNEPVKRRNAAQGVSAAPRTPNLELAPSAHSMDAPQPTAATSEKHTSTPRRGVSSKRFCRKSLTTRVRRAMMCPRLISCRVRLPLRNRRIEGDAPQRHLRFYFCHEYGAIFKN